MLTSAQFRMARALMFWTQDELSKLSGVGRGTINAVEKGTQKSQEATIEALKKTFEAHGVEFCPGGGVQKRHFNVTSIEGDGSNHTMLDDIYETLIPTGGEVLIAGLEELQERSGAQYDKLISHLDRLKKIGVTERILIQEGDTNFIAPPEWYRWLSAEFFVQGTFQLYGNKLGMVFWGQPEQVFIVEHPILANSFRGLFNFAWKNAKKVKQK